MLTARDSVTDIVHGLDCGVDDYLTKPFSFLELSARVRALIRRLAPASGQLRISDLTLDASTYLVRRGGRPLRLTKTEFQLLEVLMRNAGHVVRRRDLFREVWGENTKVEEDTLDVSMSSLRSRVEVPGTPDRSSGGGESPGARLIRTIRGFGYRMEASE